MGQEGLTLLFQAYIVMYFLTNQDGRGSVMAAAAKRQRSAVLSVFLGTAALLVVIGIVHSPGEAFRASLSGLQIWWQNVFPGLLPPLMLAELLAASGLQFRQH
jgi:hypothetical protein